jgi:DNA-binding MurR/RpiR family transcriptional regulator
LNIDKILNKLFSLHFIYLDFNRRTKTPSEKDFLISLKEIKAYSILFTDKKTGRLRKYADMSFYASSTGHGMINCITPFIVSTNILESILFSLDKHVHLTKIKNIEKKWNSLPIFLE